MKLRAKFALYNAITKIAVFVILGGIIMLSIEKISSTHLDSRLVKKKSTVIKNISDAEIDSLINAQQSFTDYNILKDEFIVLYQIKNDTALDIVDNFATERREIDGDVEIYRILDSQFTYKGKSYQLEIGEAMTAIEAVRSTIRFYMLVVLILALLITLVTDYTFTNFILKPFYKIIENKINKVNDPIAYNYEQIQTNTTDFRILDDSINSLMRKIATLFQLEKQFIANVSHELLTPISILSGRLENMLGAENLSEEQQEKIFASLKTLNRLKSIINSLLLISKIENDQYGKTDTIYIKTEIEEVLEELEDRITDKEIELNVQITQVHTLYGNKTLFHILLMNLINNAIKYNIPGGSLAISDGNEDNRYYLKITDTGIGMDEQAVSTAFNRFERATGEREDSHGLGLAIVKSIANFHQLQLGIQSVLKKGTSITLWFN